MNEPTVLLETFLCGIIVGIMLSALVCIFCDIRKK